MKGLRWKLIVVALASVGLLVAGCGTPEPEVAGSPQDTVSAFYSWYSSFDGNPLGARAYHNSEYLSPEFVQEIDALLDSFEEQGGAFDPFICAQDRPPEIAVVEADGTPELTRVTVQAWMPIYVDVKLVDWEWKIIAIHCTMPSGEAAVPPESPDQPVVVEPTPEGPPAEEPTVEAPAEPEPTPGGEALVAEIPANWAVYQDNERGFKLWYPEDWEVEELAPYPPGAEIPDGEKARLNTLLLQPRGWGGIAAPLHIDVTDGTDEQFAALYPPPSASEEVVVNGYAALKTTESFGSMFITRTIVPIPEKAEMRLVFQDMLSGFPDRLANNEEVSATITQILGTVVFEH